jgi:hypothetical protein
MKHLRICNLFLLLILLLSACQQRKADIVLSGTLENSFENYIYLSQITPEGIILVDSAAIKDGKFTFSLSVEDEQISSKYSFPIFYQIWLTPENGFTTLAKRGDHLSFSADAAHLVNTYSVVDGTEDAYLMYQLDAQLRVFVETVEKLMKVYNAHQYDDSVKIGIESNYLAAVEQHKKFLYTFIQENKRSLASITAFYQKFNRRIFLPESENLSLLDSLYQSLNTIYPESEDVKFIGKRLEIANQSSLHP